MDLFTSPLENEELSLKELATLSMEDIEMQNQIWRLLQPTMKWSLESSS
jgi:hypothetical protein